MNQHRELGKIAILAGQDIERPGDLFLDALQLPGMSAGRGFGAGLRRPLRGGARKREPDRRQEIGAIHGAQHVGRMWRLEPAFTWEHRPALTPFVAHQMELSLA